MSDHQFSPASVDHAVTTGVERATSAIEEQVERTRAWTRESPMTALACAAAAGYVLRSLPLCALCGALVRLTLTLLRPAALIFGAVKLYEIVAHESSKPRT
jgi:hypothetical protein